MDTLWRVFHLLTEQVSYTFVSINRRNNKERPSTPPPPNENAGYAVDGHSGHSDLPAVKMVDQQ